MDPTTLRRTDGANPNKENTMKKYINQSEAWGDPVEVTPADYYRQAEAFGQHVRVDVDEYGINVNGERVATKEGKRNEQA